MRKVSIEAFKALEKTDKRIAFQHKLFSINTGL